jgi:hypothetical protein
MIRICMCVQYTVYTDALQGVAFGEAWKYFPQATLCGVSRPGGQVQLQSIEL